MGTIHLPPTGKDSFSYHSPSASAPSTYCLQQHHKINSSKDYNSSAQGRPPLVDIEPARLGTCKDLVLRSHPVKISVGSQIQIRVRGPQTGRQSGKNLTLRRHNSFFGYYRPFPQRSSIFTLKNAQSVLFLQASLLSSDPSGSGLTIGPNAWLKRKVIKFKL